MDEDKEKPKITIDELARMMAAGFSEMRIDMTGGFSELRDEMNARFSAVDKRIDSLDKSLNYKIDQLDAKVEKYHQETKIDFAALRGVVGGLSHTVSDHEERIKALEGE